MSGEDVSIEALEGVAPIRVQSRNSLRRLGITTLGGLKEDAGRKILDSDPALSSWIEEDGTRQVWEFLGEDGARIRTYIQLKDQSSNPCPAHLRRLRDYLRTDLISLMGQSRMSARSLLTHMRALISLFLRSYDREDISVRDEIDILLRPLNERNRHFVATYFRLYGDSSATLEDLGLTGGITRERVRQIVTKFKNYWVAVRPPMPICETAAERLNAQTKPVLVEEWYASLPDEIRHHGTNQLAALQTLSRWGWYPEQTWYRNVRLVLVASGGDRYAELKSRAREIISALARARNNGVADISELSSELGESEASTLRLLSISDEWIPASDKRYLLSDARQTLLGREARKMVSLLGPLSLEVMRRGLARAKERRARKFAQLPSRALFPEVLKRAGLVLSENGMVYPDRRESVTLAPGHQTVLHVLTEGPPVATVHEVVKRARETGLSEVSVKLYLGGSPYIERVAQGLYARRGRPVSHLDVEAAQIRLEGQYEGWLVDQRFDLDGSIAVVYEPDPEGEIRQFYIRRGMIPTGDWKEARTGGPVRVRETYFTSRQVRAAVRAAVAVRIPYVTVRFQVATKVVTVSLTAEATNAE
jgi:hypothetical protein